MNGACYEFNSTVSLLFSFRSFFFLFAFFLKVAFEFGDVVFLGGFSFGALHRHLAEGGESFGAHLAHDGGEHFRDLLDLSVSRNCEGVCVGGCLNLGVLEVENRSVILEHVNFFDSWNGIDGEFLELALELLVVGRRRLVHDLLLPSDGTFAADSDRRLQSFQLLGVHIHSRPESVRQSKSDSKMG